MWTRAGSAVVEEGRTERSGEGEGARCGVGRASRDDRCAAAQPIPNYTIKPSPVCAPSLPLPSPGRTGPKATASSPVAKEPNTCTRAFGQMEVTTSSTASMAACRAAVSAGEGARYRQNSTISAGGGCQG